MTTQGSPEEPRRPRKRWHKIALGLVAAAIALIIVGALAGCGGEDEPAGNEPERGHVRAEDYGDDWPLTAPEAFVACTPPGPAVTVRVPGHGTYAINGFAIMYELAPELEASDPVWRDNPDIGGPKVSIGPLIDAGLELCEES